MRPEPSEVGADDVTDFAAAGAGIASDCRFESEKSTEFSWRWPVRFSTRPPSCPAGAALAAGQRDSSAAGLETTAGDAKRSPPPPRFVDMEVAAGARPPNTSASSLTGAPPKRPPTAGPDWCAAASPLTAPEPVPSAKTPPSAGVTSCANSGIAESLSQSAKPSFQT